MMNGKNKVCFFVNTQDRSIIDRVEFYKIDIEILKELGFDIEYCFSWKKIPRDVDFYFIWWWTYAIFPVLYSKLLAKKSIITGTFNLSDSSISSSYRNKPFYQRMLIKWSSKLANINILVSQYEFNKFRNEISENNAYYSPHVLQTSNYKPNNKKRENFIFTVAWMSEKNAKRKCIPEIIKTAYLAKKGKLNLKFFIAGKLEDDAYFIKELITNLNLESEVVLMGVISDDKKIEMYNSCKIYLQPSEFEGYGVSIAEAMLCRTPVITSAVGAVPEVSGDFCTYVNGHDPEDILVKIKYVLSNEDKIKIITANAEKWIRKNFSFDRRKKDIENILKINKII